MNKTRHELGKSLAHPIAYNSTPHFTIDIKILFVLIFFFKHKNANFSLDEKIYKTEPIIKMLLEEISSVMFFSNVCHRFIIEMNFIIKFFEF